MSAKWFVITVPEREMFATEEEALLRYEEHLKRGPYPGCNRMSVFLDYKNDADFRCIQHHKLQRDQLPIHAD